jgi:hypothetical protein
VKLTDVSFLNAVSVWLAPWIDLIKHLHTRNTGGYSLSASPVDVNMSFKYE